VTKTNNLKKLIGTAIQWEEHVCPKRGNGVTRTGILIELKGKNAHVDLGGTYDWKWIPQMHNIRKKA